MALEVRTNLDRSPLHPWYRPRQHDVQGPEIYRLVAPFGSNGAGNVSALVGAIRLFPVEGAVDSRLRFRVSRIGMPRGAALTNLPLAVAQARAIAVAGHRAFVVGSDGTSVEVAFDGASYSLTPHGPGTWPDHCRRLLDRHGG